MEKSQKSIDRDAERKLKNSGTIWIDTPTSASRRTTSSGMTFSGRYVKERRYGLLKH